MFERKKVSHSEKKTSGGSNGTAIKMNIPNIDGLDVENVEEAAVEEEEEVVEEKKSFVSFFKNLSLGSSSSQSSQKSEQSQSRSGGCGCFGGG